jgi:hypothetical protein
MIVNSLKAISDTAVELVVANYIILFGGRDLEWVRRGPNPDGSLGDYFTKSTAIESSYTQAGILYVDWEHGLGPDLDGGEAPNADEVLGFVNWKTARQDERGWWVERVLVRRNKYVKFLEELIRAGLLGTSSEPVQGKVTRAKDGEIKTWPLMRDTLTVQPAEPRMMTENLVVALKNLSGKLTIPQMVGSPTLAEKTHELTGKLNQLLSDTRSLVNVDQRPLSQTKRHELKELLETFSGLDAVRSDISSVLAAAPTGLVAGKRTLYELNSRRKRLEYILKETI